MSYTRAERKLIGYYLCKNKIVYKTINHAWKASFYYFTQHGYFNTPYTCSHCGRYHLTSKVPMNIPDSFVENLAEWFGLPTEEMERILTP